MKFNGFTAADFNVFKINGLESRMEALIERIRPKLETLGEHFSQELSILAGEEMFPHVAKHARRTKNPPNDTWVAFAANKRGYKMLPHFQIGLWETHIFVWFAIIYEAPIKVEFGRKLQENISFVKEQVPDNYVWSVDHTKPNVIPHHELTDEELLRMFEKLQTVKKAELLCGVQIPRDQALNMSSEELLTTFQNVFVTLLPLYKTK